MACGQGLRSGAGCRVTPHSHAGTEVHVPMPGCPQLQHSTLLQRDRGNSEGFKWKALPAGWARGVWASNARVCLWLGWSDTYARGNWGTDETWWNSAYWKCCWFCKWCLQFQKKVFNHSIILYFSSEFNANNIPLHLAGVVDFVFFFFFLARMLFVDQ